MVVAVDEDNLGDIYPNFPEDSDLDLTQVCVSIQYAMCLHSRF